MKRGKTKTTAAKDGSHGKVPVERLDDREDRAQVAPTEETKPACDETEAIVRDGAVPSEDRPPAMELELKVESLRSSLLRAKADYQNLQRRSALERSEAICFANAELMRSLLGVLDDLERSLSAEDRSGKRPAAIDGIRLVYENFVKALRTHGLEPIDALHKPFDPQLHEALIQQPSTDHAPGTVLEEVAKGYRLRERVIRPTKVVVSKAVDGEEADAPTDQQTAPDRTEPSRTEGACEAEGA